MRSWVISVFVNLPETLANIRKRLYPPIHTSRTSFENSCPIQDAFVHPLARRTNRGSVNSVTTEATSKRNLVYPEEERGGTWTVTHRISREYCVSWLGGILFSTVENGPDRHCSPAAIRGSLSPSRCFQRVLPVPGEQRHWQSARLV